MKKLLILIFPVLISLPSFSYADNISDLNFLKDPDNFNFLKDPDNFNFSQEPTKSNFSQEPTKQLNDFSYKNTRKSKSNNFANVLKNINIPDSFAFAFVIFLIISFFTFFSGLKQEFREGKALRWLGLCLIFPFVIIGIAMLRGIWGVF